MTDWDELAEANGKLLAIAKYLPVLKEYVPEEKLGPLYAVLHTSRRPPTESEIKRGQEIYKMFHGADGKRRQITMSEQVSAYLRGHRDAGGAS